MISDLRAENVETWFDLGLLIDRLREDRPASIPVEGDFAEFKLRVARGIAFVTFDYGVDGVTMEIAKYARGFATLLPYAKIHLIAGAFAELTESILDPDSPWHELEVMDGRQQLQAGVLARHWQQGLRVCHAR